MGFNSGFKGLTLTPSYS